MNKELNIIIVKNFQRILRLQEEIRKIPFQTYYEQGSYYFKLLEIRNEGINEIIDEFSKYGHSFSHVRIHQRDVANVVSSLVKVYLSLTSENEEEEKVN